MTIVIRRYVEEDIAQCIVSVQDFFENNRGDETYSNDQNHIDFSTEKLYKVLKSNVDNLDFFLNVITDNEKIVGGLCAFIGSPIFTDDRIAYDQILYTAVDFNNLKAVTRLISSYVEWAKRRGVKECRLCNSTGFNQRGFTTLCKRNGFKQFEVGFAKRF